MRLSRQDKILELIGIYEVETQDSLANLLKDNGYTVTQATVSRDIKDLQLIKIPCSGGKYKYALPEKVQQQEQNVDRYLGIISNTLQTVSSAGNIIVLKTLTGCANAAAEAVDSLEFEHVAGSLAGDNTIFVLIDKEENVPMMVSKFRGLVGKK